MQRRDVAASSLFTKRGRVSRGLGQRPGPVAAGTPGNKEFLPRSPEPHIPNYFSISFKWSSSARTEIWISQIETPSEAISSSKATPKTHADSAKKST